MKRSYGWGSNFALVPACCNALQGEAGIAARWVTSRSIQAPMGGEMASLPQITDILNTLFTGENNYER